MEVSNYKRRFLWSVIVLAIACIVVMRLEIIVKGLRFVGGILSPFLAGIVVAFIWSLPMKGLEKIYFPKSQSKWVKVTRRPVCLLLSLVIILAIISGVLYLVIPQIYNSFKVLGQAVPAFARNFQRWFVEITDGVVWAQDFRRQVGQAKVNWPDLIQYVMNFFGGGMNGALDSTVSALRNIANNLAELFVSLVFACYLLLSKEKLRKQIHTLSEAYLPLGFRREFSAWYEVIVSTFGNFIVGQVTDACILGLMMFTSMSLLRFPYALMISAVIIVTALVPMIGALMGGAVGFLMIAMVDIRQAIFFVLLFVIVQQIDNNFCYPKVVGNAIGLPGIWVFCGVIIGGSLAGAIGMLGAVPLGAAVYKMMREKVAVRHKARQEKEAAEAAEEERRARYEAMREDPAYAAEGGEPAGPDYFEGAYPDSYEQPPYSPEEQTPWYMQDAAEPGTQGEGRRFSRRSRRDEAEPASYGERPGSERPADARSERGDRRARRKQDGRKE